MSAKNELWVARDPGGDLFLYLGMPKRTVQSGQKMWGNHLTCTCIREIPGELFPAVKKDRKCRVVLDVLTLTGS